MNGVIHMSDQAFVRVTQEFKLPNELLVAMMTGTPSFKKLENKSDETVLTSFVMRAPLANSNNWTLAISWDPAKFRTYGLLTGFQETEFMALLTAVQEFDSSCMHPLSLPVMLCELLTQSDSNEIKRHGSNLFKVELRTDSLRIGTLNTSIPNHGKNTPEDDLEDLARRLNAITSRLAFHEMCINANVTLVARILKDIKSVYWTGRHSGFFERAEKGIAIEMHLQQRLQNLEVEHAALQNEISCNQKIAAGQLQIVYNLIAQRDKRQNLHVAPISTSIAAITKDDSFAMRTIAIMTVAFLPATAIPSIFSMNMFDWQAEPGKQVVSSHFWIYWVVAVPLTLAVLGVWLSWIHAHRKHQKKAAPEFDLPAVSSLENYQPMKELFTGLRDRVLGVKRRRTDPKEKDVEDTVDNSHTLGSTTSLDVPHASLEPDKIVQEPTR